MMENYKIKVNNEAESKEVQELFFELGYEWNGSGKKVVSWRLGLLFTKDFQWKNCLCYFDKDEEVMLDGWIGKELTIAELRDMVAAHRKSTEQALISGADAKLAWAKGEELEFRNQKDKWYENWTNIYDAKNGFSIQEFDDTNYEFRLKPRTITTNLEIPAPFEPKDGEKAYRLAPAIPCGYTEFYFEEDEYEHQFGAWRTEEEIKQVVAALRGALKNG